MMEEQNIIKNNLQHENNLQNEYESIMNPIRKKEVSFSDISESYNDKEENTDNIFMISNLSNILLQNIQIPSYNLNENEKKWITNFLNTSPECFEIIKQDINEIVVDNKIDLYDIALIVKLFADLYHFESIRNDLHNKSSIVAFIKFTVKVVIFETNILILPYFEINVIEKIIDSSIDLLNTNLDNIENIEKRIYKDMCCFSFFQLK